MDVLFCVKCQKMVPVNLMGNSAFHTRLLGVTSYPQECSLDVFVAVCTGPFTVCPPPVVPEVMAEPTDGSAEITDPLTLTDEELSHMIDNLFGGRTS